MLPNSPPSIQTSLVSASMHSAMPLAGGMRMEKSAFMLLPCPCNKNPPESSSCQYSCCTWGSHCLKVACRLLHENDTALSALNPYRRVGVDILDFRIVKLLPMHPLCFLDKLRCRFALVSHLNLLLVDNVVYWVFCHQYRQI